MRKINGKKWRGAELNRLACGCTGVKRSTGQHPGGIVVVPDYIEVEDITPVQYPADDMNAEWKTTHFDYHAFEENLLKLDILGHDDPTMMRMLQDLTGVDPTTIPMNDPKVMSMFSSTEASVLHRNRLGRRSRLTACRRWARSSCVRCLRKRSRTLSPTYCRFPDCPMVPAFGLEMHRTD